MAAKLVLSQLNLVAHDFEATLAFYRKLGVELPSDRPHDGVHHLEATFENDLSLEFDDENLASLYNAAWRRPGTGSRTLIGFRVETRELVDAKYAELVAAGHPSRQVPYDTFWGARYAVVADPDGNDVGIMSPQDDSRRSWPPKPSPEK